MFCKFCGNQIKDGSVFCPSCGKNQGKATAAPPPCAPQPPIYGNPQPPMYGNPQPPLYGGPGYYSHMSSAGYSGRRTFGWITAAVIALFSIIFMIGQFSFKMFKYGSDDIFRKYSFGKMVSELLGDLDSDGMTLFIAILSVFCVMTSVAFLIVALVRAKNHPASCVRFAAASLLPTIVGRIGLIIEVVHLKSDSWGGDYIHLSGSVIFSMIFCILLYVVSLVLASSVSD